MSQTFSVEKDRSIPPYRLEAQVDHAMGVSDNNLKPVITNYRGRTQTACSEKTTAAITKEHLFRHSASRHFWKTSEHSETSAESAITIKFRKSEIDSLVMRSSVLFRCKLFASAAVSL